MADPDQLRILRGGVQGWNNWRDENFSTGVDLSGANLSGANLSGANLSGANLSGANLSGANLSGVTLFDADVSDANLVKTLFFQGKLFRTNFIRSQFSDADLKGADLSWSDLSNASFFRANLSQADLTGTNLTGASFNKTNLAEANLTKANLSGATFNFALMVQTRFKHSKFQNTVFENACFGETDFLSVNLNEALGLETCRHTSPSSIDSRTLGLSGRLPKSFLAESGFPDALIDFVCSEQSQALNYYSCFLSHSHKDKSFVLRLYDELQLLGIRCWFDEHQLLPGDDPYEQITRGIRNWDKVLLCCSINSLNSGWFESELNIALTKEKELRKERGKKVSVLIPLDLDGWIFDDDCPNPIKVQILNRISANFVGWEADASIWEKQFERLINALRTDNNVREKAPKSFL